MVPASNRSHWSAGIPNPYSSGMSTPASDPVASLFGELAELSAPARTDRLLALDVEAPALAAQLRTLLEADRSAGDFLGLLLSHDEAESMRDATTTTERLAGRFRVLRQLGAGGMGTVWLAHDERLDRLVALKLLHPAVADAGDRDLAARALFETEARVAARLDHPNVAVVHDVGETSDGATFIAMAFYEGGSLAERVAAGPLPPAQVVEIGRQLATALAAAHAQGVIHGDLKPSNVLFDVSGSARLADFGVARLVADPAAAGAPVLGTLSYLAPEALRGDAADHRGDLWALGVTLHQMLTGRRPFDGPSGAAVLYRVLAEPPPPAVSPHGPVPAALTVLLRRLLEKDPAARPQSAAEVARALADLESVRAAEPAPPSTPSSLTTLVGREREFAHVIAMLAEHRLVTVTGPGGVGKTRLSTEIAGSPELARLFVGGVFMVSLVEVRDAAGVPAAIAQVLGLRDVARASIVEGVRMRLGDDRALLVLDNFEHLLDAAPFVGALLGAVPRLTILVTSRAALRLRGEHELSLPPLALAPVGAVTVDAVGRADAVQLFLDRARSGRAAFTITDENAAAVAAICRQLDGLPLAIELAAIRVRVLDPGAILTRLEQGVALLRSDERDRETRHRTLHEVIDWSYRLLGEDERSMLRALSVCAGGFTLDAAAAMASGRGDDVALLDRVAALCDWSLLVRLGDDDGEPRLGMLETIRQFARDRLQESGEDLATRDRHLGYYLAIAERAAPELRGPSQAAWLARLELDHGNLRIALDHALAIGALTAAARLVVALHWFWLVSRSFSTGIAAPLRRLEQAVNDESASLPAELRARLMLALGGLSAIRGDPLPVPCAHYESALAACRAAGDDAGVATTLNQLGWISLLMGDLAVAERYSTEALQRHTEASSALGVATACINLGWIALVRGDTDRATRRFERALTLQRERGDQRGCVYALGHLATTELRRGNVPEAIRRYDAVTALCAPLGDRILQPTFRSWLALARHEGLEPEDEGVLEQQIVPRLREAGHGWSLGFALAVLGRIRCDAGDLVGARTALEESLAVRTAGGYRSAIAESRALLGELARRMGDRARAGAEWSDSLVARHAMGEDIAVTECLGGIAWLALEDGDALTAATLLAGAANGRQRLGIGLGARMTIREAQLRERVEAMMGATAAVERYSAPTTRDELVGLAIHVAARPAA